MIKFIWLGQTVSNRAKAIISEKAGRSIHFFMQRRSAPDDRMSGPKINPSINSFGVKNGI